MELALIRSIIIVISILESYLRGNGSIPQRQEHLLDVKFNRTLIKTLVKGYQPQLSQRVSLDDYLTEVFKEPRRACFAVFTCVRTVFIYKIFLSIGNPNNHKFEPLTNTFQTLSNKHLSNVVAGSPVLVPSTRFMFETSPALTAITSIFIIAWPAQSRS